MHTQAEQESIFRTFFVGRGSGLFSSFSLCFKDVNFFGGKSAPSPLPGENPGYICVLKSRLNWNFCIAAEIMRNCYLCGGRWYCPQWLTATLQCLRDSVCVRAVILYLPIFAKCVCWSCLLCVFEMWPCCVGVSSRAEPLSVERSCLHCCWHLPHVDCSDWGFVLEYVCGCLLARRCRVNVNVNRGFI